MYEEKIKLKANERKAPISWTVDKSAFFPGREMRL